MQLLLALHFRGAPMLALRVALRVRLLGGGSGRRRLVQRCLLHAPPAPV